VNGADTVVLALTKAAGPGAFSAGAAAIVDDTGWSSATWFTSLSAACRSQLAGSCTTTPAAGTLTNVGFAFASPVPVGSSYAVTLYKSGASTGLGCTIAAGSSACTIAADVSVNGSEAVALAVTKTAGVTHVAAGTATATNDTGWGTSTWFTSVSASCRSQNAATCATTPAAGTITGASYSFASAIAAGASYTVTLYKNGTSTGSSCIVAAGQSRCSMSGLSVAVNGSSDKIVLGVQKTAGTTSTAAGTAMASHQTGAVAGQVTFFVPTGSGYTITAWGATTSAQLTSQSVMGATTKTLTVS
jgi:hypothetical protein